MCKFESKLSSCRIATKLVLLSTLEFYGLLNIVFQAFAANGFTPTAAFKVNSSPRPHGFQSMRNRYVFLRQFCEGEKATWRTSTVDWIVDVLFRHWLLCDVSVFSHVIGARRSRTRTGRTVPQSGSRARTAVPPAPRRLRGLMPTRQAALRTSAILSPASRGERRPQTHVGMLGAERQGS